MNPKDQSTRRDFIKTSSAAAAAGAIALPSVTFGKPDSRKLKLGWIGCGGRGSGAINQALLPNISPTRVVDGADGGGAACREASARAGPPPRVPRTRQHVGTARTARSIFRLQDCHGSTGAIWPSHLRQ